LGPLFARRDAPAGHAGAAGTREEPAAAGKETAEAGEETADAGEEAGDAGKEADVKAEEADEEEAAPSPWSIPLTLVGDVNDLDEEDDGQPAGSGAVEDHGTGKPPAAGERPAPEWAGSSAWTRRSWASAEEKQAGPADDDGGGGPGEPDEADRADAGRSPWLTRPGKGATAGWAGQDAGDAAAARADDMADAASGGADADDDATAGGTARWAGALPTRGRDDLPTRGRDDLPTRGRDDLPTRGRDEAATRTGGEAAADDHAKATSVGRDDMATPADRDDAAVRAGRADEDARAGRDGAADDEAKATGAAGGDGDAASRTAADAKAGAAAGTPAATAGSVSGSKPAQAWPRTPGDAKPPSATPADKPAPVEKPSTALFQPTISTAAGATPGSSADPATGKTAGPAAQQEVPSPAEEAGGRSPSAGSGTGTAGPAPARDGDERGATEQGRADGNAVVIVPGIARYHRTGCILIRFLGSDDLETSTAQEAEAKGCAPCRACEPDKPLSSGD
jgi:hypothetical protein